MSEKINAVIELANDGTYYNVLLNAVLRKGEHISFYSYADQASGHQASHEYEVAEVVHEIRDVDKKISQSINGYHSIKLIVRKSAKQFQ